MQYKIVSVQKRIDDKKYNFAIASIDTEWYTLDVDVDNNLSKEYKVMLNKHNAKFIDSNVFFEKFNDAIAALDELNAAELLLELKK